MACGGEPPSGDLLLGSGGGGGSSALSSGVETQRFLEAELIAADMDEAVRADLLVESCPASSQRSVRCRGRRQLVGAGAALLAAGLLMLAAVCARAPRWEGGPPAARVRNAVAQAAEPAVAAEPACAKDYQDNCHGRTCCNEFTTCYEKQPGLGKCRPTCALGAPDEAPPWDPEADMLPWTCKVLGKKQEAPTWRVDADSSPSLYCFAVTLVRGNEPELLRRQLATGTGVFGCNAYSLFSERKMLLGPGPSGDIIATVPIGGPMASSRNNTWDFMRAWKEVIKQDLYNLHHWTVKLDPDSVFLARKLRPMLGKHNVNVEYQKVYFRNCQRWRSIQGPLEILSRAAARAFFSSLDYCKKKDNIMPHGEDWFIGHCMDILEFTDLEDWGLLDDQYCSGLDSRAPCKQGKAAYHPFKTVERYMECLEDTA